MDIEEISKIEISGTNEMFVMLASGGKPSYQHVYREAAEVYWDNDKKGFKSPAPRQWSHPDWFHHIVSVTASGLSVSLKLTRNTSWVNVSEETKSEICAKQNI